MANELEYNGELIASSDYLAKAQSLPTNTSADGNGGVFELGGVLGAIEIVAKVKTGLSVTKDKVLTVELQHSDDNLSYTTLETLYTVTGADPGPSTVAAGTELKRFVPPSNTKRYVKAVITTTAATTGAIDIYQVYLAR